MTRALVRILTYITNDDLGLELKLSPSNTDDGEEDAEVEKQARAITDYIIGVKPDAPERIVATRCIAPDTEEEDARAFLNRAILLLADVHISHLRHVVLSDPVATIDEVVEGLQLVYGPRASILVAQHGDTDHPHFHAVVITVDPATGKSFQINEGRDHEMLHLMAARSDYLTRTASEPNALFIADRDGIFDRYGGAKVSDLDLNISVNALIAARNARIKVMKDNDVAVHRPEWQANLKAKKGRLIEPPGWADERVAEVMVRPRVKRAKNWAELHRSLGLIGILYERHGGGARLIMRGGSYIAASEAASFASLSKLESKLGAFQSAPLDNPIRPFVRPRYNLRSLKKEEGQSQKAQRDQIRSEKENILTLINEDCAARSKAHQQLSRECRKLVSEARQEVAQRKWPKTNNDISEAPQCLLVANPGRQYRDALVHNLPVLARYSREPVERGIVAWWFDDKLAFYVSKNLITIQKGADRLAAIKLAQFKWGDDFRFFGTKREIKAMCQLAADNDILAGNPEQRTVIEKMVAERQKKPDPAAEAQFQHSLLMNPVIAAAQNAQKMAREAAAAAFDTAITVSRQTAALIADLLKRSRYLPEGHFPGEFDPHERRGMFTLQEIAQYLRSTVIPWDDAPFGKSVAPVVKAFQKYPADLDTRLVQARLAAEYYRQEAERRILLVWLKQGLIRWNETRLETAKKVRWIEAALKRENENPIFLKAAIRNEPNDIPSDEPTILALAISHREIHMSIDMALVRKELAWIAAHELCINRALACVTKSGFARSEQGTLQKDLNGSANAARPTQVIDYNLIKNMTPAQRSALWRR